MMIVDENIISDDGRGIFGKILIVEDNEGLSKLITKGLTSEGFDVKVVYEGLQAIDWIANNTIDLILLDYKLPDMSAAQTINALKERHLDIPFIIMTGHGDEKIAVEMMKTGARDYILKEGDFFDLIPSTVRSVIEDLQREKALFQANEALEKSEKKYRAIVDNALVGVYKINVNGIVLYANQALSIMFEYASPGEMMTSGSLQIYKNKKDWDVLINILNVSGSVDSFECECITKNRSDLVIIQTAILEGDIISGMMINITAHKKMEKTLMQSEKLRAMGIMAAGIAHDFNNVLAIINSHVEMIESICDDNEELLDGFRAIGRAVDDGTETVRRLSEFTRMRKSASKHVLVNIVDIIKESIDLTKPTWKDVAHAGGVTYDIDIEGLSSVPNILGSPSELREVVINMINNATDAMPGGGRITFLTWEKYNSTFMSIADNGSGMSKEVQSRIFDPFYTTKGADGSGLGMSVSFGIVGKHGGRIDVISQIGDGSVFTIEFPVATKKTFQDVSLETDIDIKTNKYRILVADDVKEISGILYMFLSRQGYNVDRVDSGAEAIKLLEKESFDLVICDLGMPVVSGWDVIRFVESLKRKPKIGLITGWADMLDSLKEDDLGVDFVISKPIKFRKFSTLIKETLLKESQAVIK